MKEKDRENVFVDKVLSTLDKSAHDLDPKTLSRGRLIRTEALETAKVKGQEAVETAKVKGQEVVETAKKKTKKTTVVDEA